MPLTHGLSRKRRLAATRVPENSAMDTLNRELN